MLLIGDEEVLDATRDRMVQIGDFDPQPLQRAVGHVEEFQPAQTGDPVRCVAAGQSVPRAVDNQRPREEHLGTWKVDHPTGPAGGCVEREKS
jgi:hypothetical protein